MRWLAKAAVQDLISVLPNSDSANLVFQTKVTRNLPRNEAGFLQQALEAAKHLDRLEQHSGVRPAEANLYEFGAGWDLIGPLTAYCLGVESQTLVDIRANVRFDFVNHTLGRLRDMQGELEAEIGHEIRLPPVREVASIEDLRDHCGMTYLAPRDARDTRLPDASFDLISSTFTMEHIPAPDLTAILRESARIISPAGVISCSIDMKDHYSYFDPTISPYNFLRFSESRWKWVNPALHFQNRLRLSDYRRIFADAGLETLEEEVAEGTPEDLELIAALPPAREFTDRYEINDLAAREILIVARRTTV